MTRIEVRGVIVPSAYDTDWTQEYIEKGLITPESTFRTALANADHTDALEVYVNSPGGSVFSAYEMANALIEWKTETEQPVHFTVGALAASAASALTLMAADTISAHQNSKMMFHGATVGTLGGKEAHEDSAELLGKINNGIQTLLVARYTLDPDQVAEWFAEGREGWLTADEMREAGIADSVIGDDSDVIEFPESAVANFGEHGLDIAALLHDAPEPEDTGTDEEPQDDAEPVEDEPAADDTPEDEETPDDGRDDTTPDEPEDDASAAGDDDPEPVVDEASPAYLAGVEAGKQQSLADHAEDIHEMIQRLEHADAEARKHQSAYDKAVADAAKAAEQHAKDLARVTEELRAANERLDKFLSGSLRFSAEPQTWQEAIDACDKDYAKAARTYPHLRDKFNQENARK